jgi:hypothetical protein
VTGIHSAMVRATGRAVVLESRAHLLSKYEVIYTSDPPARISAAVITRRRMHSRRLDVSSGERRRWSDRLGSIASMRGPEISRSLNIRSLFARQNAAYPT